MKKIKVSQKVIEEDFSRRLQEKIGKKHRLLYITDRGYADVKYNCHFNEQGQLYIIRGCSNVIIEYNFRDFKSCLGVRGLKLEVAKAEKLGRLLVCVAIAYVLLIVMGDSSLARQLRKDIEVPRKRRRHSICRGLSVLTVALYMVTDSFLLSLSNLMKLLASIISFAVNGLCPAT